MTAEVSSFLTASGTLIGHSIGNRPAELAVIVSCGSSMLMRFQWTRLETRTTRLQRAGLRVRFGRRSAEPIRPEWHALLPARFRRLARWPACLMTSRRRDPRSRCTRRRRSADRARRGNSSRRMATAPWINRTPVAPEHARRYVAAEGRARQRAGDARSGHRDGHADVEIAAGE